MGNRAKHYCISFIRLVLRIYCRIGMIIMSWARTSLFVVFIIALFLLSFGMQEKRAGVMQMHIDTLHYEMETVRNQHLVLLSAFCTETNMRSRKPQELSMDQCLEYAMISYRQMQSASTPTALERDTFRRGLGKPEPTPCSGELPCGMKRNDKGA